MIPGIKSDGAEYRFRHTPETSVFFRDFNRPCPLAEPFAGRFRAGENPRFVRSIYLYVTAEHTARTSEALLDVCELWELPKNRALCW